MIKKILTVAVIGASLSAFSVNSASASGFIDALKKAPGASKKTVCQKGSLFSKVGICRSGKALVFKGLKSLNKDVAGGFYAFCVLYCGDYEELYKSTLVEEAKKAGFPSADDSSAIKSLAKSSAQTIAKQKLEKSNGVLGQASGIVEGLLNKVGE